MFVVSFGNISVKITNLRYDETLNIKHTQYPDTVAKRIKEKLQQQNPEQNTHKKY